jgi:hypothetical protein
VKECICCKATAELVRFDKRIDKFMCRTCNSDDTIMTDDYHHIEKIVNHKIVGFRRRFQIKWTGSPILTWELEKNLHRSVSLVIKYIRQYNADNPIKLKSTILDPKGGGISSSFCNYRSMDEVMKIINRYKIMPVYKSNMKIIPLDPHEHQHNLYEDTINILLLDEHFYVVMNIMGKNFIADTTNKSGKRLTRKLLLRALNINEYQHVEYYEFNNLDYCAVGAVLITLGFLRSYKNRQVPKVLNIGRKISEVIAGALYKSSDREPNAVARLDLINITWLYCGYCKKPFKTNQRRSLVNHERACATRNDQANTRMLFTWSPQQ